MDVIGSSQCYSVTRSWLWSKVMSGSMDLRHSYCSMLIATF